MMDLAQILKWILDISRLNNCTEKTYKTLVLIIIIRYATHKKKPNLLNWPYSRENTGI